MAQSRAGSPRRIVTPINPRLIVFDLDGTLIDSRTDLVTSANQLVIELGGAALAPDRVVAMIGEGARMLVERALGAAGLSVPVDDALARFLSIYDEHLVDTTLCYPGVPETLGRLARQATLAVLTNKPLAPTVRLLEHLSLAGHFDEVVGGDGPLARKPAPDGLLWLMGRAGAAPGATLMVGDSAIDLQTAQSAGVPACLVRYGFGFASVASPAGAARIIDTFPEVVHAVSEDAACLD